MCVLREKVERGNEVVRPPICATTIANCFRLTMPSLARLEMGTISCELTQQIGELLSILDAGVLGHFVGSIVFEIERIASLQWHSVQVRPLDIKPVGKHMQVMPALRRAARNLI
jgi:hypothetical protein